MSKICIGILLCFWSINLYAQHEFGAKLNLGISTLSSDYAKKDAYTDKTIPLFSGSLGFSYELKSKKIIGFESDILLSQLNTRVEDSQEEPSQGCIYCTGTTVSSITYNLTYLYLPLYLKLNFKKIRIGIGVSTGINIIDNRKLHITGETLGEPYEIGPVKSEFGLEVLDFGPILNFEYTLGDKFLISLNAYSSAIEVQHKTFGNQFFNYQFTAGMHYKFVKN